MMQQPPPDYGPGPAGQWPPPSYGQQPSGRADWQPDPKALARQAKARRPFWKKKRFLIPALLVALFIVLVATTNGGGSAAGTSGSTAAAPAAPPPPPHAITARDWQLIAKDPDAHRGESVIVYGQVVQFDAATGTETFRAMVDGVQHQVRYGFVDYPTNTVLTGDAQALQNVVLGDLFSAGVTVTGATTYDTQIGGKTTAPTLQVQNIQITGHVGG